MISKSILVAIVVGAIAAGVCFIWGDGYATFDKMATWIGYAADLAIGVAIFNFLVKETINVKGIGKVRVRRAQNNIQDLTNIISWKKFGGDQFQRNELLTSFYSDSPVHIEDDTTEVITINKNSYSNQPGNGEEKLVLLRTKFSDVDKLIGAVKYIYNDGEDLDNDVMAEIYQQWYALKEPLPNNDDIFSLTYNGKEFSVDRRNFRNVDNLIKVAACVLNDKKNFDKETLSEIYRKFYQID